MTRLSGRLRLLGFAGIIVAMTLASAAHAQWRVREGSGRFGGTPPRFPPPSLPDRDFAFCKLMYRSIRSEPLGMGWSTDYPYAGVNLMTRLSELTATPVSRDHDGEPNHWVVTLTDDSVFNCPFVMAADIGTVGFTNAEVERLRAYLLKGGVLWVDDFWGTPAWNHWVDEISRVLPPAEYPIRDVPLDHPLFRHMFHVAKVPQVTAIQFWRQVGGSTTSEQGPDSDEVHFRTISDANGRFMVVMTHNTDIADSWEREGEDRDFFTAFSPDGYALGINVMLHLMTH